MKLDFWNNPIIVSSFRVRYRRGGLFNLTAIYLMLLVVGGVVMYHYRGNMPGTWSRNYLLALLGMQFFLSAAMAGGTTANSMRSEVVSRTFDFQRISSLSPRQILAGKLFGEPALAYLLAITTIPLAVWCWMLGVVGVSLPVLALLYVNLATTTILAGSLGLLQSLEPAAGQATTPSSATVGWGVLAAIFAAQALAMARWLLATPWSRALVGLLTPVAPIYGVTDGDPWHHTLSLTFFTYEIPLLLATPVAQLVVAWLCFQIMVRRIINPLNPAFSKRTAYLTLAVVDLLAAGVLFERLPIVVGVSLSIGQRAAAFCLAHLVVGLMMVGNVTPWRESLHSWIWRLRGPCSRWRDLWLGDRSENWLALLTFCLIGLASLIVFVLIPAGLEEGFDKVRASGPQVLRIIVVTLLLLLSLGTLRQWCVAVGGRSGRGVFFTLGLILMLPVYLVGLYFQSDEVEAFSPIGHFVHWFNQGEPLNPLPLLLVYGTLLILTWVLLRRYVARVEKVVVRKLQLMGATKA